ncbi:MAG: hypothetical protein LWX83_19735, partial [Anaerolineae bacterium]|nr:hypothetical protein [Anaerolineae bacterium]
MKINRLIIVATVLLTVSLACNLPASVKATATPAPGQILDQAVQVDPNSKTITITLTEAQMNVLMNSQISKVQMPSDATLSEPSVSLSDGKITFNGKVSTGFLSVNVMIALKPVNNGDKWTFEVVDADFGSLPVPDSVTQQFAEQINNAVDNSIQESGRVTVDN